MLEHLFGSKTRVKLLRLFFLYPDKTFFVRELTRIVEIQINAIRRELSNLVLVGLIKEIVMKDDGGFGGQKKYYQLNPESDLYSEIKALLSKDQFLGEQNLISDIRGRGGIIKLFLLTGKFTGDNRAPSDLLLVGDLKEKNIARIVADYEKEFGFEIRYTTMTEKEFKERRHIMDKFLYTLFETENLKVVNEFNV